MTAPAVVRQLRLELQATDSPTARHLPERISQLYHSQLARVLDEELARLAADRPALALGRLVVEVPPVAASRLEQDLPGLLRAAVRAALASLPKASEAEATPDALAPLRQFLVYGSLPWQLSGPPFTLDDLIRQALGRQPGALRQLLLRLGPQLAVRQRLARQAGADTFGEMLELLEAAHAGLLRAYLRRVLAAHRQRPLVALAPASLLVLLRELLLADLLVKRHTRFNRQTFIERQIRQLAARFNLAYVALLAQLLDGLTPTSASASLLAILHELHRKPTAAAPAARPAATPELAATPQAALLYYLRHASLPYGWSQQISRATLLAALAAVLRQGEPALRQLLQAAGPAAAARTLARQFPAVSGWRVVRVLAADLARPAAALLASLPAQAALLPGERAAYRQALWQGVLHYVAAEPGPLARPPALRQWLLQQAAPGALPTSSEAIAEPIFLFLVKGELASASTLATLRHDLHEALLLDAARLRSFLRHYAKAYPVLRHLAALATPAEMGRLGGSPRDRAAAGLHHALAGATSWPTWLREAYLFFYLHSYWDGHAPAPAEARHLLVSYHLPAQATLRYLRHRLAGQPYLLRHPFIGWVLAGCGATVQPGVLSRLATGQRPRGSEQSTNSWLAAAEEDESRLFQPLVANARALRAFSIATWQREPVLRNMVATRIRPLADARRPPAAQLRLVGTQTAAEALETVLAHLVRGRTLASPLVGALLRQVVRQQPAVLWGRLRRAGAGPAVWERLARLATFAELGQLVNSASKGYGPRTAVATPALATLDSLAASAGPASASRFFWKIILLGFHFQPVTGSFSVAAAQRLAITLGLPWRALLTQLQRVQQQWPTLAATPFFARFWPLMRASTDSSISQKFTQNLLELSKPGPMAANDNQAATDAMLHYLLQGQAPWWAAPPARGAPLGQRTLPNTSPTALEWLPLLRQPERKPALKELVRHQAHLAPVRHRLAGLANFSLLYELAVAPGPGQAQRQLVRPALASLDRLLRTEPAQPSPRFQLFLREAFLTAAVAGQVGVVTLPGSIRQLATAAGLSWHSVLAYAARLVRRLPALAAAPFFAALFRQAASTPFSFSTLISARAKRRPGPAAPPRLAEAAGQPLEHYLQTGQAAGPAASSLQALLGATPDAAGLARIGHYLRLAVGRQRLAALLPTARELLALLRVLFPAASRQVAAPLREWLRLLAAGRVRLGTQPAVLWAEVLATAQAPWPAATLALALVRGELAASGQPPTEARLRATSQRLVRLASQGSAARPGALAGLLAAGLAGPAEAGSPATPPPTLASPTRPQPPAADPAGTYILNAGLVLLWPFLQMLFDRLGYLEQRQFKDDASAERAIHLLYFLATGGANPPEPLLLLNKLLCGVEPTRPVARELALTAAEKATGEDLLRAVLSRWEVLKNTSIAGLRETFLQRTGKLAWLPDRVTLTVETKTLDILLDRCPWSISLIKLPWMALPLYVTWR